jgi:hypothetical protein
MPYPDAEPSQPDPNVAPFRGQHARQEWVRSNFTQIFGVSAQDLQSRGIDPREYAREHREQIRQFAQLRRSQGLTVPEGRDRATSGYGGASRFGGRRGAGSAWIGVVLVLFALRFLLVDSLVGARAAVLWVLGIGGIMLVARVLLRSWLRNRRRNRR